MQIGMIGLGRMGMNMARRLLGGGHEVVAYNRTREKVKSLMEEGAAGAFNLEELAQRLARPRILWMMLPAGPVIDEHIEGLSSLLSSGDILIDGANTLYKDDIHRAERLKESGVRYVDVGVSGGIWGLKEGFCLMVGGDRKDFDHIEPILKTLAPEDGYLYCGKIGAGHFAKMVHNGIEYALMEAYGEGFELLRESPYRESLDFERLARLWNRGSVIRSWLLELIESAFAKDPDLAGIRGYVEDSGEGRWTVHQAVDAGVSAPLIAHALFKRFESREKDLFSDKVVAALRREFGGHAVKKDEG